MAPEFDPAVTPRKKAHRGYGWGGSMMVPIGRAVANARVGAEPGRVCSFDGCDTKLSRYNRGDRCNTHQRGGS